MKFVPINELKSGMVLAKDLRILTSDHSSIYLMKEGSEIKEHIISRLKNLNCAGVYIYDSEKNKENKPLQIISTELKYEVISKLEKIFVSVEHHPYLITNADVEEMNKISKDVVGKILENKEYMVNILDLKMHDDYTYHHSLSVAVLSTAIGVSLGLRDDKLYDLCLSALLHDVGKVAVPLEIINKPSSLTSNEFNVIKTHPVRGGDYIIKNTRINENIYNGVICHHEKYDGTGYPFGMKGDEIPLFGKIICVADVYDALTSQRPYRKPLPPSEAVEYIMGGMGSLFDPQVVEAFLRKIAPYPVNDCVKLSNGEAGIVLKVYPENPLRPVLKMLNIQENNLENSEDGLAEININKNNSEEIIHDLYNDKEYYNVVITEAV